MADDVRIEKSQIISGSQISGSRISNVTSEQNAAMTPEMWSTVFRLVDTYARPQEREDARELKTLLDQGRGGEAKSKWLHLRSFLGDFANVAKIVDAIDALMR